MKKILLAVTMAAVASCAFAKSVDGNGDAPPGFVPIEAAQRVMHFPESRLWADREGVVLVCPFDAEASLRKQCTTETSTYAWTPLLSLSVPGYEISGVQFMFTGRNGDKHLLVFWRKK